MPVEAGLRAEIERTVRNDHLADAIGSGDVPVLATPVVVTWCEAATMTATTDHLEPGQTTVGMRVHVDHLAPTTVGSTVTIEATLTRVEGRRLRFDVAAHSGDTQIAVGQVTRVMVDRERFVGRLASRATPDR